MDYRRPLTVLAATAALAWSALCASPICTGTVRNSIGKPIDGVKVTIPGAGTAVTGADGMWQIAGVPTGDVLAVAEKAGLFRVRQTVHAEPGKDLRWDATLGTRGVIKGRLVDEYDHPLTGPGPTHKASWRVGALFWPEWMRQWGFKDSTAGPAGSPTMGLSEPGFGTVTDAQGRFALPVEPGTLHRLRVGLPGSFGRALLTAPMSDGLADVLIRVPSSRMPHARVGFRLVAPDGAPIEKTSVEVVTDDWDFADEPTFDAAHGAWLSRPLSPGRYAVVVHDATWGTREFGPCDVPDAADVDMGTLRMPPVGRVRVAAAGDASAGYVHVFRVEDASPTWVSRWHYALGVGAMLCGGPLSVEFDLSPGCYRACVKGTASFEVEEVEVVFDVRSGETTTATVPLRAAQWRAVRFRCPGSTPAYVGATLTDVEGAVVGRQVRARDEVAWFRLPPGRYSAVVETSDERRLTGTVDIPAENALSRFDVVLR